MCSINHDLKAIYIHIPKNGGLYVQNILDMCYGFKTVYFTREDHNVFDSFVDKKNDNFKKNMGFVNTKTKGIYKYYMTSEEHHKLANITPTQWKEYFKFTFIRNPYDKIISAFKFINLTRKTRYLSFTEFLQDKENCDTWTYSHSFITQFDHLSDDEDKISINLLGNFLNVDQELINILQKLGVDKINHQEMINNNTIINKSRISDEFIDYYDETTLQLVNDYFKKDFDFFNFKKCYNIKELSEFSKNYYTQKNIFDTQKQNLIENLKKTNSIDLSGNKTINLIVENHTENALFQKQMFMLKSRYNLPTNFFNTLIQKGFEKIKDEKKET